MLFFVGYLAKILISLSILFSPLERFNFYYNFTITPIIIIFPFLFLTVLFLAYRNVGFRSLLVGNKVLVFILMSIYLSSLVSVIAAIDKKHAFLGSFYVLIYIFIIYFLYLLLKFYSETERYFRFVIISVLIVSLYALYQFLAYKLGLPLTLFIEKFLHSKTLAPGGFTRSFGSLSLLRPNSTFSDVNSAAGFILLWLPFVFVYCTKKVFVDKKYVNILIFLFIFFAFVAMLSEGAFIGLLGGALLGILLFILSKTDYSYKLKSTISVILIVFTLLIGEILFLYPRIHSKDFDKISNGSTRVHIELNYAAWRMFESNVAIGEGVSNFPSYYNTYIANEIKDKFVEIDNPSQFLKWLGELGIIGLLVNISLLAYILYLHSKSFFKNRNWYSYSFIIGLFSVLIDSLIHSYTSLFFMAIFISLAVFYYEIL